MRKRPPCLSRLHARVAFHESHGWRILSEFSEPMGQTWQSGLVSIRESRSRGGGEDFASWRRHRPQAILVVLLWPRTTRLSWNLLRTSGRRWHMQRKFSKVTGALCRTCPVCLAHLRFHDMRSVADSWR